ncbi:MAG: beta-eliminating lyase-related protein [Paracoccaceae bacterium]|nr:beta-eliminating lyase-related protein [Paracoccaceae bacterium]
MSADLCFASDNAGPVHPAILDALTQANRGRAMPYGADDWTARALAAVRETFEAPRAEVLLVPTGIAANALALATLTRPWSRVFCTDIAHVELDEAGALGLASGGAETALVPSVHGRMTDEALAARVAAEPEARRGAVSVTQLTEAGTVYTLDALAALGEVARAHGLPLHLDGARWSNAVVALGCTPDELVRAAGAAALSLGASKAGAMGVEAVVLLDPPPGLADEARLRRQRMGLTVSKHRYLAAQLVAWLEGGLWRDMAEAANAAGLRLAHGLAANPAVTLDHPAEGNMVFARLPCALHRRLQAAGAVYYPSDLPEPDLDSGADDAPLGARFVCDWATGEGRVDALLAVLSREEVGDGSGAPGAV